MPFAVRKEGDKWVVVTKDTGKVHGTHPSKKAAVEQLKAMYSAGADKK